MHHTTILNRFVAALLLLSGVLGLPGPAQAQAQSPSMLDAPVTKMVTGEGYSCALTTTGKVECWGDNNYGQLGDGTTTHHATPVDVTGLAGDVVALAGGYYHVCALTTTGGVQCSGYNASGQLGDGTTTNRHQAVDVNGMSHTPRPSPPAAITAVPLWLQARWTAGAPMARGSWAMAARPTAVCLRLC